MRPRNLIGSALVTGLVSCSGRTLLDSGSTSNSSPDNSLQLSEDAGSGRYFPLLPPYYGVDFAANFNKLRSPGDASYFVVRDTIAYVGLQLMWLVIHTIIWDGQVSNLQDISASLLSPGKKVELTNSYDTSRLSFDSLSEVSLVKLWNFFADSNPSTRNLYLSFGFGLAQQLLWIIPTFIGKIPDPDAAKRADNHIDRTVGLPEHLLESDPVALWNRLLSPQGIVQIIAINTLLWLGRILFWTVMSNLPDLPAATVITGRSHLSDDSDRSLFHSVKDEFIRNLESNVEMMIQSLETSQSS